MSVLFRFWAVFVVAAKRIFSNKGLVLANLFGLVVAVALTMSIPLYTDSIYYRIFNERVTAAQPVTQEERQRSPFAFMFRYIGSWSGPIQWEKVEPLDKYLSGPGQTALGLPNQLLVRHFATDTFRLFPQGEATFYELEKPLAWIKFSIFSDFEKHITITEGSFPKVATTSSTSVIDVLASETLATKLGMQIGENYTLFEDRSRKSPENIDQFPVHIVGIWKPTDAKDPYWFYSPDSFEDEFIVPEDTFKNRINPYRNDEVNLAVWYYLLDGSHFNISETGSLIYRITAMQQRVDTLLPNADLSVSPMEKLLKFQRESRLLTIILYAFSVPFIGLMLAFIMLVSGLSVEVRRNEIAMIRSRGLTIPQITGIAAMESLFLGILALVIGAPASQYLAKIIGQTRSFLTFNPGETLRVQISIEALYLGIAVVVLAIVMQLAPTLSAARHTVVTYKVDRARSTMRPWWQRANLDLLLLIPTGYGAYLLSRQGSIAVLDSNVTNDPFSNPLLFLVPVLGIFAITLLCLRFIPVIMASIAWLTSHSKSIGLLLAARQLARSPGFSSTPLVLLTVTLSLSAFTASLAQTLDNHLYDQIYYKNGADLNLYEFGQQNTSPIIGATQAENTGEGETSTEGPAWVFLPVSEHMRASGIKNAARVGTYPAIMIAGGSSESGSFMGLDRIDFPMTAFWRRDFAHDNLGTLMNSLALASNAVLVPRNFLDSYGLSIGDPVRVEVKIYDRVVPMTMKITNYFDLFPTWYPDSGPLFVTNLDYIFEQAGEKFPYRVWVKSDPAVQASNIIDDLQKLDLNVLTWEDSRLAISQAQAEPNRQGMFGMLTVGFAASAVITVLSFLLYALFSFRRRFIELGVLRAIGLSAGQMTIFLASELAFLVLVGAGVGTGLGIYTGKLFIPYLQVGTDASALIPSFVVVTAWPIIIQIYGMIGILFLVALSVLVVLLLRMKVFQAIKLGETV